MAMIPADAIVWTEPFGPTGPKFSKVSGDEKKGPYSFLLKMAAGTESGWHTHDADYSAVVISGSAHNIEQGGEAADKALTAGATWTQPAKANHLNKCDPGADCIVYIHMTKGFSFTPKMPDGKPVPKEAAPKKEEAAAPAPKK
jgi:quercetin dioxygenase-like cupin family protein